MNRRPPRQLQGQQIQDRWRDRTPLFAVVLLLVGALFVGRLFYLQIIKHDVYKAAATAEQYKKFSIPASRGSISLLDGDTPVPIVLNEDKYLVYADPMLIDEPEDTAEKLYALLGKDKNELKRNFELDSRYVVIAKKISRENALKIQEMKLKGIVTKAASFRTYPEGITASQLLGFVNDEGEGQYGVEGYLDKELRGKDGLLKGVTDINGVPLAGTADNILSNPERGDNIVLTIDSTMQRITEEAIKNAVEKTNSTGGSIVVMEANTGAVKAMANWPSYDPRSYESVTDLNLFKNRAVTDPLEVGSIMKVLTLAAAFDQGVVNPESTYYDQGFEQVGEFKITNAINFGSGTYSVFDIIRNSLNTGAVHLLKSMGGGEINDKSRTIWHEYLTSKYGFGKTTGIEQAGEAPGIVPDPTEGDGLDIQYANTSFGQGTTETPLQMAAALSSAVNGGTYYKPYIVSERTNYAGVTTVTEPTPLHQSISKAASDGIVRIMERYASTNNKETARNGFSIGGKTGTAQIPDGKGGYREDLYNGTYAGFVGAKSPEYVVIVRIDAPRISGYAGSDAARPIFTVVANGIMDNIGL